MHYKTRHMASLQITSRTQQVRW